MEDSVLVENEQEERGVARIKPEFIVKDHLRHLAKDCLTERDKETLDESRDAVEKSETNDSEKPPRKLTKQEKKKLRGQNKSRRPPFTVTRDKCLCSVYMDVTEGEEPSPCTKNGCQFLHDVKNFMASRPADIGTTCYNFTTRGRCAWGAACRYGGEHITEEGRNKVNVPLWEEFCARKTPPTVNTLTKDLQWSLRKRLYDFKKSEAVIKSVDNSKKNNQPQEGKKRTWDGSVKKTDDQQSDSSQLDEAEKNSESVPECASNGSTVKTLGAVTDEDQIALRPAEKKTIDWKGKLSMTPLTTVGNLPFRRICKEFGVDITCGEMAMATSLLQAHPQEWALAKRHETENIFGVQVCGNNPHTMTKCAQVLQETAQIDFIDINLGCPIDLVYREGAGSGLLRRKNVLQSIVKCMSKVMTIPLTLKTRTGISCNDIVDTFMPSFKDWGVSLITVHGRTREQRYTRMADWSYIDQCAKVASPVPVFGNGDILSYEDYKYVMDTYHNISGAMIGRGALIKPWIFTEIKEQRMWDISSSERFDILKRYVNYGLEHWGSDTKGVENTRRFLLEWISFLHRYIPVGLLERPPQKINDRPPVFRGRDELETLMASPNCADWIKISEMLLGPTPDGFHFLPKHKANSWK